MAVVDEEDGFVVFVFDFSNSFCKYSICLFLELNSILKASKIKTNRQSKLFEIENISYTRVIVFFFLAHRHANLTHEGEFYSGMWCHEGAGSSILFN